MFYNWLILLFIFIIIVTPGPGSYILPSDFGYLDVKNP